MGSRHTGESHGGLYLLDIGTGARRQVVDWDSCGINWAGRGVDRGLRGIAFHCNEVWVAAADELLVYDQEFQLQRSFKTPYLADCQGMSVRDRRLYLISTGFDSVLEFDLDSERFSKAWLIRRKDADTKSLRLKFATYDPNKDGGPAAGDTMHLNNVHADKNGLFVSGFNLPALLRIADTEVKVAARLPVKTRNAQPYNGDIVLNNPGQNRAERRDANGRLLTVYPIPRLPDEKLTHAHSPKDHVRQSFGCGIAVHDEPTQTLLLVGSWPATVSVFDFATGHRHLHWRLTDDVRSTVHGLVVWPFETPALMPAADGEKEPKATSEVTPA